MGMFDEIEVKKDLPLPEKIKDLHDWKNHRFQTKDLDNVLSLYYINEYDELVEKVTEREYIPYTEEEKKKIKPKPWSLWKEVIEGETRYENTNYHGKLNFYTYESLNDEEDFSIDFEAYFVYGKLDKIEMTKFEIFESYKIHNKRIEKQIQEEQKKPWNRFKYYASYIGWRWFWRKVENLLYKAERLLSKIRFLLIKYF